MARAGALRIRRAMKSGLRLPRPWPHWPRWKAALRPLAVPAADRVFLNGRVWTADPARPRAQALALAGETILAVGTTRRYGVTSAPRRAPWTCAAASSRPDSTTRTCTSSLVDTVDLTGAASVSEEIQRRIQAYATAHPDLPWITGRGWALTAPFPGGLPDRRQPRRGRGRPPRLHDQLRRPQRMGELEGPGRGRHHARHARSRPRRDRARREGEPTGALKESASRLGTAGAAAHGRGAPCGAETAPGRGRVLRADRRPRTRRSPPRTCPPTSACRGGRARASASISALPMAKDIAADELARYKALRAKYPAR